MLHSLGEKHLYSPINIIGKKVDHLTNGGFAERAVGELQSLSADGKRVVGWVGGGMVAVLRKDHL